MPITTSERAELENAIERHEAIVDGISADLNNMREKTGPAHDAKKWADKCLDYTVADKQLQELRHRLDRATKPSDGMTKTDVKNAIEASPSTRFISAAARTGNGNNGLESWEIEAQRAVAETNGFENIRRPGDYVMPLRAFITRPGGNLSTLIQEDVQSGVIEKLVNFGGAKKMAARITTAGGNPIKVPGADETGQEGEMIGENATAATAADVVPTEKTLNAYTFSSKSLNITKQAIADTGANGFDLIGYQMRQAARRLSRITNKMYTAGTGTNQPQGVTIAAGDGHQIAATGGGANVVYKDFVDTIAAVDDSYLAGGEMDVEGSSAEMGGVIGWQFNRAFETVIMKLLDGDSRPLWAPGLSSIAGSPRQNMLLGYPYALNYHMASDLTGAGKVVALFGNFSYFMIRDVDSILIRLYDDSGTADTNSVQILGYSRSDSRYIGTGATSDSFVKLRARA